MTDRARAKISSMTERAILRRYSTYLLEDEAKNARYSKFWSRTGRYGTRYIYTGIYILSRVEVSTVSTYVRTYGCIAGFEVKNRCKLSISTSCNDRNLL